MRVRIQALAFDFVDDDDDDLISIMGIFTTMTYESLPAQSDNFYAVFYLDLDSADIGRAMRPYAQIVSPSGDHRELSLEPKAIARPDNREPYALQYAVGINGLVFTEYGPHEFRLMDEGAAEPLAWATLEVLRSRADSTAE